MSDDQPVEDAILNSIPMPKDAALLTHSVTVVAYLTEDGSRQFQVFTRGEAEMTAFLGLLYVAEQTVYRHGTGLNN